MVQNLGMAFRLHHQEEATKEAASGLFSYLAAATATAEATALAKCQLG